MDEDEEKGNETSKGLLARLFSTVVPLSLTEYIMPPPTPPAPAPPPAPSPSLRQLYSSLTSADTDTKTSASTNTSTNTKCSKSPTQPKLEPERKPKPEPKFDAPKRGRSGGGGGGSTASEAFIVIDSSDDDSDDDDHVNNNNNIHDHDHVKQSIQHDQESDDDTDVKPKPKKRAALVTQAPLPLSVHSNATATKTKVAAAGAASSDTDDDTYTSSRSRNSPPTATASKKMTLTGTQKKAHKDHFYSPLSTQSSAASSPPTKTASKKMKPMSTSMGKQKDHAHPPRLSTASTAATALNTTWDDDEDDNEEEDEPEHDTNHNNNKDDDDDDDYSDDAIYAWSSARKSPPSEHAQQPVPPHQRQQHDLFGRSNLDGGTCKTEHVQHAQRSPLPQPVRSSTTSSTSPEKKKKKKDPPQSSSPSEMQRPSTSWRRSTSNYVSTTSHKVKDVPVAAARTGAAPANTANVQEHEDDYDTTTVATAAPEAAASTSLMRSCWKCAVDLAVPNGEFCLYATHAHAVLNVPVCSVCADQVAAVDMNMNNMSMNANNSNSMKTDKDSNDDDNDDMDQQEICAGCAASTNDEDEDALVLFCCDKEVVMDDCCDEDNDNSNSSNVCGRVFCKDCVEQAHGGGAVGRAHAQALQDDCEGTWFCLACEPPAPLQMLQLALEQGASVYNNDATGATTGNGVSVASPRSVDTILMELCLVETAKRECEEMCTDEKYEEQRLEFVKELSESLSGADLEEAVQEELTEWNEVCYNHDLRLGDTIASLQDELETVHNVDLAACYEKLGLQNRQGQSGTADDARPDWARSADRELDQRRSAKAPDPSHPSVYQASIPTQVEDLDADEKKDDGDSMDDNGGQWRHCDWKISKDQIDEALEYEAAEFGLDRPPVVNEAQDARETLVEEQEASTASGNGRVRRDKFQMVRRVPLESKRRANEKTLSMASRAHQEPGLTESPKNRLEAQRAHGTSRIPEAQPPSSALKESTPSGRSSVASEYSSGGSEGDMFARSSLVLCSTSLEDVEKPTVRTVTIATPFVKILKPHQVEGIKFIWENSFCDFAYRKNGDPTTVGGCILAHNMGLGKSLTCIALLHAVLNIPSMVCEKSRRPLLKSVILVVPVNTVANWENEFRKWADHLDPSIRVSNLTDVNRNARPTAIRGWENRGGVLLLSDSLFTRLMGQDEYKDRLQCDILVLDEAHTTLSNKSNASYKALSNVKTPRRIALTGSPVQNNLLEYYMMVNWIRPNIFGMTESMFDKTFVIPITKGMASDAPKIAVYNSMSQSKLLNEMLLPYVQRKDATELMKDLPPMQQVVLHIRQSRMQCRLYRYFQRFQKTPDGDSYKNFFSMYTALRPIHNHPGCLMLSSDKASQTNALTKDNEKNSEGGGEATSSSSWWMNLFKKESPEKLKEVENGFKIVLLLHILVISERLGDKVLVFSQCLKTLDFIEEVLARANWSEHVSSLASSFPGKQMGSWKKGTDYLRIDGDINSAERGGLVDQFNGEKNGDIRAFLISSKAGGMGINLPAANRVVLFDSHFNPTVTTQAVFRAYRYGQEKNVFVYRLLTEGSIEEKVYSRSVNKTGVAIRVVDGKSIKRSFTAKEVEAMQENLTWVQCDKCEKWRMLPSDVSEEDLPEKWLCKMNLVDVRNNTCEAPERDQLWYERHLYSTDAELNESPIKCMASDPIDTSASQRAKKKLVSNDEILEHLLDVTERQKKTTMISKFYFHEALLESTKDSTEEIQGLREALEAEQTTAEAIEVEKTTMPSSTQSTSPKDSAQAKKALSSTKPCATTSSSTSEKSASATTTSMAATDIVEPAVKRKSPDVTKVVLEKAKASPVKARVLKEKPPDASEEALEQVKVSPSKRTAPKQKTLDASEAKVSPVKLRVPKEKFPSPSEVAPEQVKASPSERAVLTQKSVDASKVADVKPKVTLSKHTPSKRTLSARSSPRRSHRHKGNPKKERSSPETDRGLKRGLSPDASLVSSQKDVPTPSKKHGRWTGSSSDSSSPSTQKQQSINDLLDMDSPADTSKRGSVEKKATPSSSTGKPRAMFTEYGKEEAQSGRTKKTASKSIHGSAAKSSSAKSRSKETKPKARSKSRSKEAKLETRSRADTRPAPSSKPPSATDIIDLT